MFDWGPGLGASPVMCTLSSAAAAAGPCAVVATRSARIYVPHVNPKLVRRVRVVTSVAAHLAHPRLLHRTHQGINGCSCGVLGEKS